MDAVGIRRVSALAGAVAVLLSFADGCKPAGSDGQGTSETNVTTSGPAESQGTGPTNMTSDEPPACGPGASCACGTLGCACGPDRACSEGVCAGATSTCTLERDGMMRVPAGAFWMGCREEVDTDAHSGPCSRAQLPYREVTIDAFWIDRLEVTRGAYRLCMDAGVCAAPPRWDAEWYVDGTFVPGRDDMPVASVTWLQARTYCEWLGKRLPSDAEWEKAARGTDGRKYPWGSAEPTCERGNFMPWDIAARKPGEPCAYRSAYATLTPVGMFCERGASPYGVCDMAGNVLEWAADGYDFAGYEGLPAENLLRPPMSGLVSRRGSGHGAWTLSQGGYSLRTSQRQGGGQNDPNETLETGLRCARSD